MKRRGIAPVPPPTRAVAPRTLEGGDIRDGLMRLVDSLARRADTRGETGAVQDWQSVLNGLPRRAADGADVFLPTLDVDGDLGPQTRFATKKALTGFGLDRLTHLFS